MTDQTRSGVRKLSASAGGRAFAKWSEVFLEELAATSNVSAAAKKAGVATATVYEARRVNADFYARWQVALCEGYELLEMGLLQRLREGEVKRAAGARRGVRTFDNATALRLLAAHKDSAARTKAIREHRDAEAVLASIDAKLERMRQRWLAAKADEERAAADTVQRLSGPEAAGDGG
ncbi:MAG: hypothetical protein KGN34_08635 [Sphingomonadales bacterium]|nr:hypothetical protein [Sphingomonadales bacterium]